MYKLALAHGLGALAFLTLAPGHPWCYWALWPMIVWVHIAGSSFWAVIHRAMLNTVEEHFVVAYTNLWMLSTSFVLGITPILAGKIIDWWGMSGFHACFILAGAGELGCAYLSPLLVRDGPGSGRRGVFFLADPFVAARGCCGSRLASTRATASGMKKLDIPRALRHNGIVRAKCVAPHNQVDAYCGGPDTNRCGICR